jgi:hypothetical protein
MERSIKYLVFKLEEKKLLVGMQILNAFVISSRNIGGSIPQIYPQLGNCVETINIDEKVLEVSAVQIKGKL